MPAPKIFLYTTQYEVNDTISLKIRFPNSTNPAQTLIHIWYRYRSLDNTATGKGTVARLQLLSSLPTPVDFQPAAAGYYEIRVTVMERTPRPPGTNQPSATHTYRFKVV